MYPYSLIGKLLCQIRSLKIKISAYFLAFVLLLELLRAKLSIGFNHLNDNFMVLSMRFKRIIISERIIKPFGTKAYVYYLCVYFNSNISGKRVCPL